MSKSGNNFNLVRDLQDQQEKKTEIVPVFLIAGILFISIFTYTPSLRKIAYFSIIFLYILFIITFSTHKRRIVSLKTPLLLFSVIASIYIYHLFTLSSLFPLWESPLGRVPAFIVITGINLFLVPRVVNQWSFLSLMSLLSSIVVIVGFPTIFGASYEIWGLEITPWINQFYIWNPLGSPIEIYPITSFFQRPNSMSRFILVGFLSSLSLADHQRNMINKLILSINGIGLVLAHSRATLIAGIIGVLIYLSFRRRRNLLPFLISVSIAFSIGILLLSFFLGLIEFVPREVNLTGRRILWRGTVEALKKSSTPLFGVGPGITGQKIANYVSGHYSGGNPHNSYLRMFLTTGYIGGVAYFMLIFWPIVKGTWSVENRVAASMISIGISLSISQFFAAYSLFGLSGNSIPAAITFGYIFKIIIHS